MKKYLMTGIAALAMGGIFTSCGPDMSVYNVSQSEQVLQKYEQSFVQAFGEPAPTQTWGFGSSTVVGARGTTRTITVNGDAYDKFPSTSDVAEQFPTAIPEGAIEYPDGLDAYIDNSKQIWDRYAVHLNYIGKDGFKDFYVTKSGDLYVGNNYANPADRVYNIYINVDGNLTIYRQGAEHINFYILKGNITFDSNYGECGGIISVAEGATVNDQRSHIAHNDGVKVYNRGTYNSVNTNNYWNGSKNVTFDIGNHCTFYNEGKFTCRDLSYSPGDANTSYFVNLGDNAEMEVSSMTLNSAGNFFNSGKAVIAGETNVTQKGIYWVNAGHYTTGTMTFSAKNSTFYNYCQLIVTGNAHMYDGEFNLMNNSYTEAATAEFDNFIVNMGSNSGINIKGATNWIAQGDGTYQGFRVFDGASGSYVRLGGKATVASHKRTLSISSGITYFINEIEIIKNGSVVTEQQLKDNQDGDYPVLDLNGTKAENLTVIPNTTSCGATWSIGGGGSGGSANTETIRVMGEDLTINTNSDFDFNDVVFDVTWGKGNEEATIVLKAAGGELPIYIVRDDDELEIHALFANANPGSGITQKTMINTATGLHNEYKCPQITLKKSNNDSVNWDAENIHDFASSIKIIVYKKGSEFILNAPKGDVPSKIAVGTDFEWCDERQDIDKKYFSNNPEKGKFSKYVSGQGDWNNWYHNDVNND